MRNISPLFDKDTHLIAVIVANRVAFLVTFSSTHMQFVHYSIQVFDDQKGLFFGFLLEQLLQNITKMFAV